MAAMTVVDRMTSLSSHVLLCKRYKLCLIFTLLGYFEFFSRFVMTVFVCVSSAN